MNDFYLVADIEEKKIGSSVRKLLASKASSAAAATTSTTSASALGVTLSSFSSDSLLSMISFCGRYGSSGGTRYNIEHTMEELEIGSGNVYVLEVMPRSDEEDDDGERLSLALQRKLAHLLSYIILTIFLVG